MRERIKKIMEDYGLKPSSFADRVGVSRPTISQILGENGRQNDPSVATIDKILKAFPDISKSWFISGEGEMYIRKQPFFKTAISTVPKQQDLFGEKTAVESSVKSEERENPSKIEDKKPEIDSNPPVIKEINQPNNISKKIDRIMIFFSDKTFMTFISEE